MSSNTLLNGAAFNAIVAHEVDGQVQAQLQQISIDDLPDNDVLVQIDFSTLNYKDALAVSGKSKICRSLPMVCGIDLAGTVIESSHPNWSSGDKVLVNGYGLSETQWGGYSQYQRVSADWLVAVPSSYSTQTAMALGTAGYTAMLCVQAIQDYGISPDDGPIVVSGASGGVGSVALKLLAKLNYESVAVSGRESTHDYLLELGASRVIARDELSRAAKPLEKEIWAAGIDTVGSTTLATMLAQTKYAGLVAACGLAGGFDLPTTVMPFILRSVVLQGIDSVMAPMSKRQRAWKRLAELLNEDDLSLMSSLQPMSQLPQLANDLLQGKLTGRVIIDVNA